ncbi:MAG: nucleotidyltransferase family protein [Proteobacteria bacterium]|nr:nucleotidyltransferase family protein [Pseudomonadota bacterium]
MVTLTEPTAMILAAGRGSRMGALGKAHPKALLNVGGKPLIQHHIENLRESGFSRIVINVNHLGDQIKTFIHSVMNWGLEIYISEEATPLETAGGIANAMSLIRSDIFPVINADIFSELPFHDLREAMNTLKTNPNASGYLFLVNNPTHHPMGDFCLEEGRVKLGNKHTLTFCGIGVYKADLFHDISLNSPTPLAPILKREIKREKLLGHHFDGLWSDVGTPDRLEHTNKLITQRNR